MNKEFILDGKKITTLKRFYDEIEKELLVDTNVIDNWSLDIFDDILLGGYGLYNLEEKITIRWTNFRRSEKKMKPKILESIIRIIQSHTNITFVME